MVSTLESERAAHSFVVSIFLISCLFVPRHNLRDELSLVFHAVLP